MFFLRIIIILFIISQIVCIIYARKIIMIGREKMFEEDSFEKDFNTDIKVIFYRALGVTFIIIFIVFFINSFS